jgi:hypothetical protein
MTSLSKKKYFRIFHDTGFWLTFSISLLVLIFFYGKILTHPNTVYFSNSGDGLQSYYTTIYHIKYDSTYSHFQGMNYPYGDHVMFTNCQPAISNTMKFISSNIVDVSDYAVAVVNLMMLLSIVVAAVFLYLIFREFDVDIYYSTLVATGIAFLSPMIIRFTGHYSLSYVFTIPAILYGTIRFYKNPKVKKSIVLGLFILLMSTFHLYNYAFAAFILFVFWAVMFFTDKTYRKWKLTVIHIFLQFILPLLVINIWLWLTDNVTDRTSSPFGFFSYKSRWEGVFIPDYLQDTQFVKSFFDAKEISWEGWAFVGHVATFVFLALFTIWSVVPFVTSSNLILIGSILVVALIFHFIRKRRMKLIALTDNKLMNIFLWTGLMALMVSYALPFLLYPESLEYAGPLRQLRSVGRFSWIFFYALNIGAFYFLYKLKMKSVLRFCVLGGAILLLGFDAYMNNKKMPEALNNTFREISDIKNNSAENKIIQSIDKGKYQSVIPLPFFHVGSEVLGFEPLCDVVYNTFLVSMKTGIPTNACMLSRTSIGNSVKNISLVLEPVKSKDYLNDYNSEKPFLLVVDNCDQLSDVERNILSKATLLVSLKSAKLYELPFEKLKHLSDSLFVKVQRETENPKLYGIDGFLSTDSLKNFVYNDFCTSNSEFFYMNPGAWAGDIRQYNHVFEGTIPAADTGSDYVLSFWIGKITTEEISWTQLEFMQCDSLGNDCQAENEGVLRLVKILDSSWALCEYKFRLKNAKNKIKVTLWNDEILHDDTLFIDNLMVRPVVCMIYQSVNKTCIMKNNRFYNPD